MTSSILLLTLLVGIFIGIISSTYLTSAGESEQLPGDGGALRNNIPINATIGSDYVGSGLILRKITRDGWLAQLSTKPLIPNSLPVHRVIVLPTQTNNCMTQAACTYNVRFLQTFNIESLQNDDIIYNFLIGGDGNIYEGRGWDFKGAHMRGYNDDSVSFAFIGTFLTKPSERLMNVTKLLLDEGVRSGKLAQDYKILSPYKLNSTSTTQSDALYESFKDGPHWSDN